MVWSRATRMPLLLSCRLLVLSTLTMVQPFLAVACRHFPANAPVVSTASFTPTPQIEVNLATAAAAAVSTADDHEVEFSVLTWKRGRHYQDMSPGSSNNNNNIILETHVEAESGGGTTTSTSSVSNGHRLLLGSAPPSCAGKCGSCVPCSPIHISLGGPHGSLTQQEYYPEAWRCKCGNRFFMP